MGAASRAKGATAEREVAAILTAAGFPCERNARNGLSAEDVAHAIPGVYLEVKRKERLDLHECLAQVHLGARERPDGVAIWGDPRLSVPILIFRRNRTNANWPTGDWHACLPLDDLIELWKR